VVFLGLDVPENDEDLPRYAERLERGRGFDEHGAIRAHRERGAQLLLCFGRPDGDREHLDSGPALLQAQRLLERDLIERVDAHLQAFDSNT